MKTNRIILALLLLLLLPLSSFGAESAVKAIDTDISALGPQPEPPDMPVATDRAYKFTLLRIAPFSGINPFDYQSLRTAVTAARSGLVDGGGGTGSGNSCTQGPLALITAMPVVPPAEAYIDVNPISNSLSIRQAGGAGADTALIVSIPVIDMTRFVAGPGWQAINPLLPQQYQAGAPPQTFVLRRTDSGDFYRLTISFLGTSLLTITNAAGDCCGLGGCP